MKQLYDSLFLLFSKCSCLGVYYCQQLTQSVCPSVCHEPSNCFFFVSRWNPAILWPSVLHVALYKTLFFDFLIRPLTSKIYSPKFAQNRLSRLVWQIDRRCLGLPGGFRGCPIQWNRAKCFGLTLVAMATKFGLGAEIQSPTGLCNSLLISCLLNVMP